MALKNVTNKKLRTMFDGRWYDFEPDELKVVSEDERVDRWFIEKHPIELEFIPNPKPRACSKCQGLNSVESKFCASCGHQLIVKAAVAYKEEKAAAVAVAKQG